MQSKALQTNPAKEKQQQHRADTARPRHLLPGLALCCALALAAMLVRHASGIAALSPLATAMVLGIVLRNVRVPLAFAAPGITFSLRRVLRFAIVLLGFQLTLTQIATIGWHGIVVIVATLAASFVVIRKVGALLGVDKALSELIAAGTSVCGASAIVATNTVTRGSDEDVAYAIACVTVFGSISMLAFPPLAEQISLTPAEFGLWTGATIHEVAQVVGAAFQGGTEAGQTGTVAKLSRVILLAPLILTLGTLATRTRAGQDAGGSVPMPWFVLGFAAVVLVNSVLSIPAEITRQIATWTTFLLTMALAAMGLETDIAKLHLKGLRPLLLGAIGWIFISVFGLALILWLQMPGFAG
ncbi:YeiH family protein [Roseovarius pacificus]|uniref:YeiH family protein n=1 Tax=Roseovarius pacificus TaxID=337701 RepID=UPI004039389E